MIMVPYIQLIRHAKHLKEHEYIDICIMGIFYI